MNEKNLFKSLIPLRDFERPERLTKFDVDENIKLFELVTGKKSDVYLFGFNAERRKLTELVRLLNHFHIDEKRITVLFDEISKKV